MTASCEMTPRILIADDQPDLLDALKLLLKGQGIEVDAVTSPEAALRGGRSASIRPRPDGPELHGRHDVGPRGHRSARARAGARSAAAGRRDDRLGQRRSRGRGHAPRRARLRAEAVGQRAPARHAAARRSRRAARGAGDDAGGAARAGRGAARSSERLLPQQVPQIDGWELAVSWQPASGVGGDCFDTIRFGDTRLAHLDRRRRRQGHPGRAADVEPAGRRPRVCVGGGRAARALSAGESHPVRQHRRRTLHQLLLCRARRADGHARPTPTPDTTCPMLVAPTARSSGSAPAARCSA